MARVLHKDASAEVDAAMPRDLRKEDRSFFFFSHDEMQRRKCIELLFLLSVSPPLFAPRRD